MKTPDPFLPSVAERLHRARTDLSLGLAVGIDTGTARWLVLAATRATPARLRAMLDGGDAQLVLTARRAETLKIRIYDDDLVRLPLARDATAAQIQAIVDPAQDLAAPLKGPFAPLRGGDASAQRAGLTLVRQAQLLPAVIARPVRDLPEGIVTVAPGDPDAAPPDALRAAIAARLPIAATTGARLHVFQPESGGPEHYAVEIGQPDRGRPVLTRLHSACFTGDVLGSLKCDCGPQLQAALAQMAAEGAGVLLYLNQEGRGIGLANKMRAYALQDQGFDTVEANHRLGFDDDERDFGVGLAMLRKLGVRQVRLLTNNPRKLALFEGSGIELVARVPLWVGESAFNRDYLRVKSERSGHLE
ncbi:GTP cyclohydrolase II [Maribius pontilimi]|uniref:GTP cyclohydrolase-2 n=1 Tax=Palleronia pontilimi TaxID=1964209 RepID=A0A934IHX4_9RHOB|nr:GTP cyclohydrolase II [Palleronia pontilimi]MBJ3763243.1 GTP cyclohydrolase II [Palleronia pontilimi]